jgi:fructose-1,6-bisphosphatase/inositol monophosphatase family enzyme
MHIGTITDLIDHVQTAGEMALDAQRDLNSLERDLKEDGSIVTRTDRQVEEVLYAEIAQRYPEANILTEETARSFDARKPYTFCIDPIDGTDVYSQGMAGWCVSVGLLDRDLAPIAGILYAPRLGLLFVADVGRAATFNGAEIRLPGEEQPLSERANLMVPSHLHHFLDIRRFPGKIRSLGSAALHLCYPLVYRAVYAAIQVPGAHIWDIAAAHAICASLGFCFEYIDGSAVDYRPLVDGRSFDKVILSGPRPHIEALKRVITQI